MKRSFDPIYTIINPEYVVSSSGGQQTVTPTYESGTSYEYNGIMYVYFTTGEGVAQNGYYTLDDDWNPLDFISTDPLPEWGEPL